MRGLRESLRLLARSPALLAALSPAAASGGGALAAAPATQAASALRHEAAALRRWLHSGGLSGAWQQQLVRQQQQWLARQPGAAAELQCLRRLSSGPRRAKDMMEGVAHKNKNSGWYYVRRGRGGGRGGGGRLLPHQPVWRVLQHACSPTTGSSLLLPRPP